MADKKISQLTALETSDDADVVAIVDTSESETKKQTKANLLKEQSKIVKDVSTKTDNYTLANGDEDSVILMNVSTAKLLTVPLNSSVAFTTGISLVVVNTGSGSTEITASAGVTINRPDDDGTGLILEDHESVVLAKVATNTWQILKEAEIGNVVGPNSATDENVAVFNGATGKIVKDGGKGLPSGDIVGTTDTQTQTNKRIQPRSATSASGDISPDLASDNIYQRTAQAGAIAINAPTGTPVLGEVLVFIIKDDGTSRAITFDATYKPMGSALPTATTISKRLLITAQYDGTDWLTLSAEEQ